MTFKTVTIGDATLILGDCLQVLQTLPPHDLGIHDPPYGIGENAHRVASRRKLAKTTDYGEFDWDSEPMSDDRIRACISAATETIIWGGNYFCVPPARGWLVWDKVNGGNCFADCELAWTNIKMSVRLFRHMWNGMLRDSEKEKRVHPTQKPIALMEWCVSHADEPKSIIDACMGSGTVGIAAAKLGLRYTGIEKMRRNFDIACERIDNAYRQRRMFA